MYMYHVCMYMCIVSSKGEYMCVHIYMSVRVVWMYVCHICICMGMWVCVYI